jgi:hypothetical protein
MKTADDYFSKLVMQIFSKNPELLESLKTSEDKDKIYTPLGYIDKSKLKN